MTTSCIVMAAGKGTRLRSSLSKMLLPLDGRPLVAHPVAAALRLKGCEVVVVVGHQGAQVRGALRRHLGRGAVRFATQRQQRGTADAVAAGLRGVRGRGGSVLILSGDVPLISTRTLGRLLRLRERRRAELALLTMRLPDPAQYGRVVREGRRVVRVVEHADASAEERAMDEVNAGIYCVELSFLRGAIGRISSENAQGEMYLTDLVEAASGLGSAVAMACDPAEVGGVNTWAELAVAAKVLRDRKVARLMASGVCVEDPERILVHSGVRVGADTYLGPAVELTGSTRVGKGCRLEAGVVVRDSRLADGVVVRPYSVLDSVRLSSGTVVEPHVHLRSRSAHGKAMGTTGVAPERNTGHDRIGDV